MTSEGTSWYQKVHHELKNLWKVWHGVKNTSRHLKVWYVDKKYDKVWHGVWKVHNYVHKNVKNYFSYQNNVITDRCKKKYVRQVMRLNSTSWYLKVCKVRHKVKKYISMSKLCKVRHEIKNSGKKIMTSCT